MATAPEEIHDDHNAADDPNANPNEPPIADGDDQGNGEDSPYAPLAKDMGWVPKDQFSGAPDDWKDPETFIRAGRDIQRETSRELKTVRQQLDTIARTSASIVEQQVKERVDQLTQQYNKAVDDGDPAEAFKIAKEITTITAEKPAAAQPSPEAQSFADRNSNWFNKPGNEYATARAVEICNTLAAQGYDAAAQLSIAEQRIKQEMPQLFTAQRNGKPAPGVHAPGSRGSGPSNRAKGFSDMPKEAQDIARDMADRGVIKSTEDYAKNYFANLQAKA